MRDRTVFFCGESLRIVFVFALLFAAGIYENARATTLARMSIEKMSQTATLIVRARCIANSTSWDAGDVWTFTTFETVETWKGSAQASITVRLLGGRVGNLTSSVSGIPRFRPGEDVILFLEKTRRGDFSITSWAQGTLRIRPDVRTGAEKVTQDTASVATFEATTRQFGTTGVRDVALDDFRARVRAALGATRQAPGSNP